MARGGERMYRDRVDEGGGRARQPPWSRRADWGGELVCDSDGM